MKLTYTLLQEQFLRNIGKVGSTDSTLLADFKSNLGQRQQMVFASMQDYMTQQPLTDATVAATQYYHYPPGITNIEDVVVTVGSVNYTLDPIVSQKNWDLLNAIQVQASAIPQFFFPRRDDYGIWPIPQAAYTITFNYHIRQINLTIDDYTAGTVTVTNDSKTITGAGTTWTAAMVNRWFTVTDATSTGQGQWYRISVFTAVGTMTLENEFAGATGNTLTYRIGQAPEIPDEGHIILVDGATADFYAGLRSDVAKATWFNNKFWTGDGNNTSRKEGDQSIKSGLIGLMNRYGDRNNVRLVNRKPRLSPLSYQVWATTLS